jgi:hypothetical protein
MPKVAVPLFVESALLVAVTVIPLPGELGAVNVAVVAVTGVTVPLEAVQVKPAPVSFATVAVSVTTCPTTNPPTFGAIVTPTPPTGAVALIVIVADADFVPSATDVAAIVTVAGLGTVPGPVYVTAVPDALVVAESEPQLLAVAQESDHVTPLLALSFETVAVKLVAAFTATVAVVGVMLTATAFEPPPGGVVVLEPPPHPATRIVINAATAHIRRQLRCFCARTMKTSPVFVVRLMASF